jgi:hypothetical protein
VTRAVTKEDAVRQCPPFFGVFLDTVLQDVHARNALAYFVP